MKVLLAVLCILALPATFAATAVIVEEVQLTAPQLNTVGERIYAPFNTPFAGTLSFRIKEPYTTVAIQTGTLSNRDERYNVGTSNGRTISQPVTVHLVSTAGDTKDVAIALTARNGASTDTQTITLRFAVDRQAPKFLNFGTASCTNSCTVRTGENTLVAYFEEQGSGIDPATVVLTQPSTVQATTCTTNTCSFSVHIAEEQGPVQLALQTGITDRAGNQLTGQARGSVGIDNDAPIIKSITARQNPSGRIVSGPFDLQVTVDDASPVTVTADLSEISDGEPAKLTCTANVCTVRVTPRAGTTDATIKVTVTDSAGFETEDEATFNVVATENSGGSFWDVSGTPSTARIDRAALKRYSRTIFIPLKLEARVPDVQYAYAVVDGCTFSEGEKNVGLSAQRQLQGDTTNPVLAVTISPSAGALDAVVDAVTMECTLRVFSVQGGKLLSQPQTITYTTQLQVIETPLIEAKITELQKKTDEEYNNRQRTLNKLNTVVTSADLLCRLDRDLSAAGAVMNGVSAVVSAIPLVPDGAVQPVSKVAYGLQNTEVAKSSSPAIGQAVCSALTCEGGGYFADRLGTDQLLNTMMVPAFSNQLDHIAGWTTLSSSSKQGMLDPYKSQYIAYATGCLPAILHHQQVQQQINCAYNQCLKVDVASGQPVSICSYQKADATCRYTYGGIYDLVPFAHAYSIIKDNVVSVVTNPIAIIGGFGPALICDAGLDDPTKIASPTTKAEILTRAACKLPHKIKIVYDRTQIVNRIKQIRNTLTKDTSCPVPIAPSNAALMQLNPGLACGNNRCCVNGICRIGTEYYKEVSLDSMRFPAGTAVDQKELNNILTNRQDPRHEEYLTYMQSQYRRIGDESQEAYIDRILQNSQGKTLQKIDEDDRNIRAQKRDLDRAFEVLGMDTQSYREILGDEFEPLFDNLQQSGIQIDANRRAAHDLRTSQSAIEKGRDLLLSSTYNPYKPGTKDPAKEAYDTLKEQQSALITQLQDYQQRAAAQANANGGKDANGVPRTIDRIYQAQESIDAVQETFAAYEKAQNRYREAALAYENALKEQSEPDKAIALEALRVARAELSDKSKPFIQHLTASSTVLQKELEKENSRLRKELQKKAQLAADTAEFQRLAQDNTFIYQQGVRSALQLSQMTSTFGLNKLYSGNQLWKDYSQWVQQSTDVEAKAVDLMCSNKNLLEREDSILGVAANNRLGLYLQGTRTEAESAEGPITNQYVVSGRITAQVAGNYKVYLNGPSGQSAALREGSFSEKRPTSFTNPNLLYLESAVPYTEVCIALDKPFNALFTESRNPASQSACVPLVVLS